MSNLSPEAQAQLAKLATDLAHNPKTRKAFTKLVQEIDPSKRFPDVEIDEIRAGVVKEFEERDQRAESARVLAAQENARAALKDNYDDKAIGEIETLMTKHGLSDYSLGARLYAADTKPANPSYEVNDHKWNLPAIKIEDFGNLKQLGRQRAYQAIDDIRSKRVS